MRTILIAALVALIVLMPGLADAKTVFLAKPYGDIYLYGGERLEIYNDDIVPHSLTSVNTTHTSFDTGKLLPNQANAFGFSKDGQYPYYDAYGSGSGIIYVDTNGTAPTLLATNKQTYTTETYLFVSGEKFGNSVVISIQIQAPDGSIWNEYTVQSTNDGDFSVLIALASSMQNGQYWVSASSSATSKTVAFQVQRPISEPIVAVTEPSPTTPTSTNSTTTEPDPPSYTEPDPPSYTEPPLAPITNSTTIDRDFLIAYAQEQIKFWQQILLFLNSTDSS